MLRGDAGPDQASVTAQKAFRELFSLGMAESESDFLNTYRDALTSFWGEVRHQLLGWKSKYQWPLGATVEAALSKRNELERMIRHDLDQQGYLLKRTFDSVIKWGFGTDSGCSDEEIRQATKAAFRNLQTNRVVEAASELVQLPKIGISRASKVLALSDQNEFGIYDSRSAHGLSGLQQPDGRRLVLIPPGRVIAGDNKSKDEYCVAFQRYTWVLRYFRSLAAKDSSLHADFTRVADLEIAFFAKSRASPVEPDARSAKIPRHLETIAERDEESLFWTLGPGRKAKPFWALFHGSSVTVLTGAQKTPITLTIQQMDTCLKHFGREWFPLSNSKTPERRDPRGLGEYFARNFGSSVFASHFASLWVHQGQLEADFRGAWWFRVRRLGSEHYASQKTPRS